MLILFPKDQGLIERDLMKCLAKVPFNIKGLMILLVHVCHY